MGGLGARQRILKMHDREQGGVTDSKDVFVAAPSFAQRRLWWLSQFAPASPVFNICGAVQLDGALDVCALTGSLNEIVRRHEPLRTTFSSEDGEPLQIIATSVGIAAAV